MELVRILDHVNQCYSNEDGQEIHGVLFKLLSRGEKVKISFAGVDGVTSSFINSSLIDLLEAFSFDFIKTHLIFVDTTKQINSMINQRFKFEVKKRKKIVPVMM